MLEVHQGAGTSTPLLLCRFFFFLRCGPEPVGVIGRVVTWRREGQNARVVARIRGGLVLRVCLLDGLWKFFFSL